MTGETPNPLAALRDAIECYIDDVCPDKEFMEARGNQWWAALADSGVSA